MIRLVKIAAIFLIATIATTVNATPVGDYGNLKIQFSSTFNCMTICSQSGNPIQLRGMSSMGLQWYPWGQSPWGSGSPDTKATPHLAAEWGATVVRAAMYVGEGGYLGNETAMTNKVKSIVDAAITAGIYVIVDWHILGGGTENPRNHQAQAEAFFASMSALYGNKSNVIWEICNEPNGATTWADIKTYATGSDGNGGVINAIRSNDPDNATNKNIIIVGTPNWSQKVWLANASPINLPNIMYAFHFYASSHYHVFDDSPEWTGIADLAPDCKGYDDGDPATLDGDGIGRAADVTLNRGNIAIFATEWGVCEETGSGTFDQGKAAEYVDWMAARNISWTNWSLCNKGETASALAGSGSSENGWNDASDLSASGLWVKPRVGTAGTPGPTVAPTNQPTNSPTEPPTSVPTSAPTAGPTQPPTSAATSAPTSAPTAGPTAPPSGGLKVQYQCGEAATSPQGIKPNIKILNNSGSAIDAATLKVRYWYTKEGTAAEEYAIYYASQFSSKIIVTFGAGYYEIGFAADAGNLNSGTYCEIQSGFHKTDWNVYDQPSDWSFNSSFTSFTDAPNVTLYQGGVLVWGTEPTGGATADPTAAPTQAATGDPTQAPTAAPTQAPTGDPTQAPTAAPTQAPTAAPTTPSTAGPTTPPTSVPTTPPTADPTAAPTAPPAGGCDNIAIDSNSGDFNTTGAYCFRTQFQIGGWGASNFDGRTVSVTVNGTGTPVTVVGGALPAKQPTDYYHFSCTAGSFAWARIYWW